MSVPEQLKNIIEAALLAAGRPLSLDAMQGLFSEIECPSKKELREALQQLGEDYTGRGIEIAEVASGWRIQVGEACSPWVSRLWDERPARYSRALMETLALVAYRQPITRGEIEDIRGVSVSTHIVKTQLEREWVHVVGQRDVPGKPSLYGTTREFLDYFGLKSLDELPTLAELRDLDEINRELDLEDPDKAASAAPGDADTPGQAGDAAEGGERPDEQAEVVAADGESAAEAGADADDAESSAQADGDAGGVGESVARSDDPDPEPEPEPVTGESVAAVDEGSAEPVATAESGNPADSNATSDDEGDDTSSQLVAQADDDNAEVLDFDDDIHPAYAQAEVAPAAVSDGDGTSESEAAPVAEPERQ